MRILLVVATASLVLACANPQSPSEWKNAVNVTAVQPGGAANAAGVSVGNIVVEVNQTPVMSKDQLITLLELHQNSTSPTALWLFHQGSRLRFYALPSSLEAAGIEVADPYSK